MAKQIQKIKSHGQDIIETIRGLILMESGEITAHFMMLIVGVGCHGLHLIWEIMV